MEKRPLAFSTISGRVSIHKKSGDVGGGNVKSSPITMQTDNSKILPDSSPDDNDSEDEKLQKQSGDEADSPLQPETSNINKKEINKPRDNKLFPQNINPIPLATIENFTQKEFGKFPETVTPQKNEDLFSNRAKSKSPVVQKVSHTYTSTTEVFQRKILKDKSPIRQPTIVKTQQEPKQIGSNSAYEIIGLILIVATLLAVTYVTYYGYGIYLSDVRKSNAEKKICPFNKLHRRYPLEEESLWKTLKYGIEEILNQESPDGPSVYLFLRNKNSTANLFLEDVADLSASCFDPKMEPVTFIRDDFNSDDYGLAIEKYKENIHEGGVLIVLANLNEVPGKAARALHTICDKYSPIVKKVVIFLSLLIDADSKGRPIEIADQNLRKLWSSLSGNELDPLIIRVSDTVFRLKS